MLLIKPIEISFFSLKPGARCCEYHEFKFCDWCTRNEKIKSFVACPHNKAIGEFNSGLYLREYVDTLLEDQIGFIDHLKSGSSRKKFACDIKYNIFCCCKDVLFINRYNVIYVHSETNHVN